MSWLLVALIPGLLMLATFGLERVEASLTRDAAPPTDAVRDTARRPVQRDTPAATFVEAISAPRLPTRELVHPLRTHSPHIPNPEFRQTPHANPV